MQKISHENKVVKIQKKKNKNNKIHYFNTIITTATPSQTDL
jgi:hypothetical protein